MRVTPGKGRADIGNTSEFKNIVVQVYSVEIRGDMTEAIRHFLFLNN